MPLTLTSRQVGDITVTTCSGRIVDGPEGATLQQHLEKLLPHWPCVVLNVADVGFVDSSGLGLLLRFVLRARAARGDVKLSGLQPRLQEVLRATKLLSVFDWHPTEEAAVAAFYGPNQASGAMTPLESEILFVDPSVNVLAYVREIFHQAGYGLMTVGNLPDALILLRATRPKLVIVAAALRAQRGTRTAETFHQLADGIGVIEMPDDFSTHDPVAAGERLLASVRERVGSRM